MIMAHTRFDGSDDCHYGIFDYALSLEGSQLNFIRPGLESLNARIGSGFGNDNPTLLTANGDVNLRWQSVRRIISASLHCALRPNGKASSCV